MNETATAPPNHLDVTESIMRECKMKPNEYVDPAEQLGWFARSFSAIAATRAARFLSRHISWKLDPILLRLTGGRLSSTLVFPTAVLETVGAKTGRFRRNAVIYFHDDGDIIIVASNAGASVHPAWFHNLVAQPEVTFRGTAMTATIVRGDAERQRLWGLAANTFPAFENYRRDADVTHRTIPVIRLQALSASPGTGP